MDENVNNMNEKDENCKEFSERVKRRLDFLFDSFGFKISDYSETQDGFEHCSLVLETENVFIHVERNIIDGGHVDISIGSILSKGKRASYLDDLIDYINKDPLGEKRRKMQKEFVSGLDQSEIEGYHDLQLITARHRFEAYAERIFALFTPESYRETEKGMHSFALARLRADFEIWSQAEKE